MTGEIAVEILHVTLLVVFSDGSRVPINPLPGNNLLWDEWSLIKWWIDLLKLIGLILGKWVNR